MGIGCPTTDTHDDLSFSRASASAGGPWGCGRTDRNGPTGNAPRSENRSRVSRPRRSRSASSRLLPEPSPADRQYPPEHRTDQSLLSPRLEELWQR